VILSASLLTGCISFTEQEMTYNIEANRLTIFQEYRGIHARSPTEEKQRTAALSKIEQEEIDSVMNGERTFFFSNWIMEYNRSQLEEQLADYSEGKATPEEMAEQHAWIPLIQLLLANVKVTNGDFYYDEKQRLSGYQVVRVTNLNQLTAQASRSISQWILQKEPTDSAIFTDQIRTMATADHSWVRHDRNKITISYPASAKEYAEMHKSNGGFSGNNKNLVTTTYKDGIIVIDIGSANDLPIVVSKVFDNPYNTTAVDYISAKYSIKKNLDIAGIKQALFNPPEENTSDQN
jgi:hypothetical protein